MSSDDFDDFMTGGGAKSFPFDNVGDSVTGVIVDITKRQQTDMDTGEPKFWGNGEPRWMYTIQLQTELSDGPFDDGMRSVNVKWKSLDAVRNAVRAAGGSKPEIGGKLRLTYAADGPKERGKQAPKEWTAQYKLPEPKVQADDFMESGPVKEAVPDWAKPEAKPVVAARPSQNTLDLMRQKAAAGAIDESEVPF